MQRLVINNNPLIFTIMKKKEIKKESTQVINRMHDYREHLKTITNGLVEMAKAAGRTDYTNNQLLRECYNLVNVELHTFDGWKKQGCTIRKGQHAYLFWGKPVQNDSIQFCPVQFLFAKEQVTQQA